jgi:hypothetical protein
MSARPAASRVEDMNAQVSSPASGTQPGDGPVVPPGEQFFSRIRALGIVRPDEDRWMAGVCTGLARRWGVDPRLVRGLFVVVSIVSVSGLASTGWVGSSSLTRTAGFTPNRSCAAR